MPEEGNINPQGLPAGSTEFEELEIELTDEDKAELSGIDWSGDSTEEPEEENTAEPEVGATEDVPEVTEPETTEDPYEPRYKELQAEYTRARQENKELQQRIMAQQYSQEYAVPQFQPQQPFQPTPMDTPYATETERLLAERLEQVEKTQSQRDYQEWQRNQREAVQRADGLVRDFKAKHGDMTDDQVGEVLAKANQAGTYDLDLVYRGMRDIDAEIEQAEKRAQVELIKKLREKKSAGLEPSAQPGKESPPIDVSKLSEEQRHALMVKELLEGG